MARNRVWFRRKGRSKWHIDKIGTYDLIGTTRHPIEGVGFYFAECGVDSSEDVYIRTDAPPVEDKCKRCLGFVRAREKQNA